MTSQPTLATTIVVPTIGRPSLQRLLDALAAQDGPRAELVVVVDDTPDRSVPAGLGQPGLPEVVVLRSGGRGPAAARNLGWRRARTEWVSFLDDDVELPPGWAAGLAADLAAADRRGEDASQARIEVPLPTDRAPTDDERGTAGLASARWITADLSYRRDVLVRVGGFDERFRRAYREDADLALRVQRAGGRLGRGSRVTTHPPATGSWRSSVSRQAGNADDRLMTRLHGRSWRGEAAAPPGRLRWHLLITAAGAAALATRRRLPALLWLLGTAELAAARIAPGPRTLAELSRMVSTSVLIPPAATAYAARGWLRHRTAAPWRGLPDLVLFDRDGTLIENLPLIDDPEKVRPVPTAAAAVARLRAAQVRTGVATNQAAVGRGETSAEDCDRVNARVEELLGPFDTWQVCRHTDADGCDCRKPRSGMVRAACTELGVPTDRCVLIGDTIHDVAAAESAGAVGVLVPTAATRREEVRDAAHVAPDLASAVGRVVDGLPPRQDGGRR